MLNWFYMGGYAAYVWSSYALLCSSLVGLLVHARRAQRQVRPES